jgi:hypothetical protein
MSISAFVVYSNFHSSFVKPNDSMHNSDAVLELHSVPAQCLFLWHVLEREAILECEKMLHPHGEVDIRLNEKKTLLLRK